MNVLQITEFLANKKIDAPRYYCKMDDSWFVLVVNAKSSSPNYGLCLLLDGPVSDANIIVEFTSIQNEWAIDPNYNSIVATGMMRQLDRCLDMTALVTNNLFAIKYNGVKTIAWTKGTIDSAKVFSVMKQHDNFNNSTLAHDKLVALNRFSASLNTHLSCSEELKKLQQEFVSKLFVRKEIANSLNTPSQNEKEEEEIILVERNCFDFCLSISLQVYFLQNIKNITKTMKF